MSTELKRLLRRFETGDCTMKRPDYEQLSDLSRAGLAAFCDGWPAVPVEARRRVIEALNQMAEESYEYSFERVFRQALEDPDAAVRAGAIHGLWESEDEVLAGRLMSFLQTDPAEIVRAAAAIALGKFVYLNEIEEIDQAIGNAVESALFSAIHNSDETLEVRRRAVEAISFSCNPDVADVIQDAYDHEDARMRLSALFGMGRSGDRRWRKIVLRELGNPDQEFRFEAARSAGELELRDAVQPLAFLAVQDDDIRIRLAAIASLGKTGGKVAGLVLSKIIESGDEELVDAAQDALEEWSFLTLSPEISDLVWGSDIAGDLDDDDFFGDDDDDFISNVGPLDDTEDGEEELDEEDVNDWMTIAFNARRFASLGLGPDSEPMAGIHEEDNDSEDEFIFADDEDDDEDDGEYLFDEIDELDDLFEDDGDELV